MGPLVAILSFQSRVVYGHVGNAMAEFALRRLGYDVWPIDTVSFSNHPGHGSWRGRVRPAAELADLVEGLAALGALPRCRAVLSGYLGSEANGRTILAAVDQVRAAQPDAPYCCDPVMGDRDSGVYVADAIVAFFRERGAPSADVLTPNHFELELLAGRSLPRLSDVLAGAQALRARGPRIVVVSSLATPELQGGTIGTLAAAEAGAWLVTTPRLRVAAKGAGDLLAAVFLARWLERADPAEALSRAVASTFAVIDRTAAQPEARDLLPIEAQDAIAAPPRSFPPVRID
jgi:pyridoxine kinase